MVLLRWTALSLLVINFFLLYQLGWSDTGYFAFRNMQKICSAMEEKLHQTDQENIRLSQEIRILKNDPEYLGKIVRTRIHHLGENELLYLFPQQTRSGREK